jgi:hypothetical protein
MHTQLPTSDLTAALQHKLFLLKELCRKRSLRLDIGWRFHP